MDYKFVGKYTNKFKIPESSENFFVKHNNEIYEYRLIPTKEIFKYNSKSVIAYKQNGLLFVMYEKKLEIYKDGKLHKKYKSIRPIIDNNGIFLITEESKSYIVTEKGTTAFCLIKDIKKVIYFLEDGTIFYTEEVEDDKSADETNTKIKDDCECYDCKHTLPNTKTFFKGYLVSNKINKIRKYNEVPHPVCNIDGYIFTYLNRIQISNIIKMSHKVIDNKTFIIILAEDGLYVIYKNMVVYLKCKGFIEIVPERMVIHNYLNERNISEVFATFAFFIKIRLDDSRSYAPERLLCRVIKNHSGFSDNFYCTFINNLSNKIICKAFKLIDEDGKMELLNYIKFKELNAEESFLVIPYFQEEYKEFIDKAIKESKLFLVKDFYEFMKKGGREIEVRKYLLQCNILLDSEEYDWLVKLQEMEMESQRIFSK